MVSLLQEEQSVYFLVKCQCHPIKKILPQENTSQTRRVILSLFSFFLCKSFLKPFKRERLSSLLNGLGSLVSSRVRRNTDAVDTLKFLG